MPFQIVRYTHDPHKRPRSLTLPAVSSKFHGHRKGILEGIWIPAEHPRGSLRHRVQKNIEAPYAPHGTPMKLEILMGRTMKIPVSAHRLGRLTER